MEKTIITWRQSDICWPPRFWVKWSMLFLGALALGIIVGVLLNKPAPSVKKRIIVMGTYQDDLTPSSIPAHLYFTNPDGTPDWSRQMTAGAEKTYVGGSTLNLVVCPLDAKGRNTANLIPVKVPWPYDEAKGPFLINVAIPVKKPAGFKH